MAQKKTPKDKQPWEAPQLTHQTIFHERPSSLPKELFRAFKAFWELARGYITFRRVSNCVTVFGSARFPEDHIYYKLSRRVGQTLAKNNFIVMTGGGPGVMEAANRGAKDMLGRTIGCNINIHHEQFPNQYLDQWITFDYFFVRKVMLTKHSRGFIYMPGGFGTLDELFEMTTLIQTEKIRNFPVVLMGTAYWQPLIDFFYQTLVPLGTIDKIDVEKIKITDSPEEAVEYISNYKRNGK